MKKSIVLIYGITNYIFGSTSLIFLIAFLFNLMPSSNYLAGIDGGTSNNLLSALVINLGLISLFGLQHSIMARPRFKKWLSEFIPEAAERSTFMMATAVVVFSLCFLWQPMPAVIWQAENTVLYYSLFITGLSGWTLVFYSTFLINHFDLFGLRQVWLYFRGKEYTHLPFQLNSLYRYVRHPIMTGVFIGIWFSPVMTVGHLLFSLGMSIYIMIGVYHEEKDLITLFGNRYLSYIRSTNKFIPSMVSKKKTESHEEGSFGANV